MLRTNKSKIEFWIDTATECLLTRYGGVALNPA
jgi:hypothetical protein